jgi:ADP-heptose:LPS heptosyltransferase
MKLATGDIKKIAIFRPLQLGDLLCAVPAIRALRKAYPLAHITLIGLPWAEELIHRFPNYFDAFIPFPGYPGLPEQPVNTRKTLDFLSYIQEENFDLVIQMQGNGSIVNSLVRLFAAKYTAGFYKKDYYCPDAGLFLEYPDQVPEIERHLLLMNFLGIPSQGTDMEFPLYEQDQQDLDKLELPFPPKQYICIHPGSRNYLRQWPPEYFARLADYCSEQGIPVIITGTKEESQIAGRMMKNMQYKAINTMGRTTLGAVGVLINNAYALISNCTGVSHIAAALKTPGIVISMDGEPERWAPLNKNLHRTIDWKKDPDFDHVIKEVIDILQHVACYD